MPSWSAAQASCAVIGMRHVTDLKGMPLLEPAGGNGSVWSRGDARVCCNSCAIGVKQAITSYSRYSRQLSMLSFSVQHTRLASACFARKECPWLPVRALQITIPIPQDEALGTQRARATRNVNKTFRCTLACSVLRAVIDSVIGEPGTRPATLSRLRTCYHMLHLWHYLQKF